MKEYWRLTIERPWGPCSVCGTEQVLRQALDEWREYRKERTHDDKAFITIHGFTDTADRADCEMTFLLEHVQSMCLIQMR
jgi:hypothetical protein